MAKEPKIKVVTPKDLDSLQNRMVEIAESFAFNVGPDGDTKIDYKGREFVDYNFKTASYDQALRFWGHIFMSFSYNDETLMFSKNELCWRRRPVVTIDEDGLFDVRSRLTYSKIEKDEVKHDQKRRRCKA